MLSVMDARSRFDNEAGNLPPGEPPPPCPRVVAHKRKIIEALEMEVGKMPEVAEKEIESFVESIAFKLAVGVAVLINTVQMGVEADYPQWTETWQISAHVFTGLFTFEAALKLFVMRQRYFMDAWNILDFVLVIMAIVDTWVVGNVDLGIDLQSLSILRVLRLVRLVRIVRLVKHFKKLVLVIKGVVDAMVSTFWVAGVLLVAIYIGAVFCVQFFGPTRMRQNASLYPGYTEVMAEIEEKEVMTEFNPYTAFGSVLSAMLTLFNIAILAEWSEIVRPIMVKEPGLVLFFITYVLFVTFGIMNVIIGMIVDNVMQSARQMQDEERTLERQRKIKALVEIQGIVSDLDKDQRGKVSLTDLAWMMQDDDSLIRKHLAKAELQLPKGFTPEEMLCMLDDDGDYMLDHEEFIQSFYRLIDSGEFQQICMVQTGVNQIKRLVRDGRSQMDRMESVMGAFSRDLSQLDAKVANQVSKVPPWEESRGEQLYEDFVESRGSEGSYAEAMKSDAGPEPGQHVEEDFDETDDESFQETDPLVRLPGSVGQGSNLTLAIFPEVPKGDAAAWDASISAAKAWARAMSGTSASFGPAGAREQQLNNALRHMEDELALARHHEEPQGGQQLNGLGRHQSAGWQEPEGGQQLNGLGRHQSAAGWPGNRARSSPPRDELLTTEAAYPSRRADSAPSRNVVGATTVGSTPFNPRARVKSRSPERAEWALGAFATTSHEAAHSRKAGLEHFQDWEALFDEHGPLGLEIHWRGGLPVVGSTKPDGSAAQSGVFPGDVLVACNNDATAGKTREEILKLLQQRPLRFRIRRGACPSYV